MGNLRWNTTGITVLNSTYISHISDLFFDANDTMYIVDEYPNSVVVKLPKNAIMPTLIAGVSLSLGSNSTQLNYPQGVYIDAKQNLYVTDYYNYRIQKYINGSFNGVTIAGITMLPGSAANQFGGLRYLSFDPSETYMYVTDCGNHRIMRYLTNSTTGTNGTIVAGGNGNGSATNQLSYPWGIDYRPMISDFMYITNYLGHTVTKWAPGASLGTFVAGTPGVAGSNATSFINPMGIKLDANLNMFVVDNGNHRVQMFCYNNQTGVTVVGNGTAGNTPTLLSGPRGIAFDSSMNMYVSDHTNMRIQKFLKL